MVKLLDFELLQIVLIYPGESLKHFTSEVLGEQISQHYPSASAPTISKSSVHLPYTSSYSSPPFMLIIVVEQRANLLLVLAIIQRLLIVQLD